MLLGFNPLGAISNLYLIYGLLGGSVIIWQHRDNIQRLLNGTERRIGNPAARIEAAGVMGASLLTPTLPRLCGKSRHFDRLSYQMAAGYLTEP